MINSIYNITYIIPALYALDLNVVSTRMVLEAPKGG